VVKPIIAPPATDAGNDTDDEDVKFLVIERHSKNSFLKMLKFGVFSRGWKQTTPAL
jgi:hypothetical protein